MTYQSRFKNRDLRPLRTGTNALFSTSVLGKKIIDPFMTIRVDKVMWDALEAKFGVADVGSELYIMEQDHD